MFSSISEEIKQEAQRTVDEFVAKIKKETAREILTEFKRHGAKGDEYFVDWLAKRYGVEVE